MTRGQLPQSAGSLGLNGGGTAAVGIPRQSTEGNDQLDIATNVVQRCIVIVIVDVHFTHEILVVK